MSTCPTEVGLFDWEELPHWLTKFDAVGANVGRGRKQFEARMIMCKFSAVLSAARVRRIRLIELTLGGWSQPSKNQNCVGYQKTVCKPSLMSFSRISQAKIVGFSLLYCSIFATTLGVATLKFPIQMKIKLKRILLALFLGPNLTGSMWSHFCKMMHQVQAVLLSYCLKPIINKVFIFSKHAVQFKAN